MFKRLIGFRQMLNRKSKIKNIISFIRLVGRIGFIAPENTNMEVEKGHCLIGCQQ